MGFAHPRYHIKCNICNLDGLTISLPPYQVHILIYNLEVLNNKTNKSISNLKNDILLFLTKC